jgi:hypothetical protein
VHGGLGLLKVGSFRIDFGARLHFVLLLVIDTASNRRDKQHDPER